MRLLSVIGALNISTTEPSVSGTINVGCLRGRPTHVQRSGNFCSHRNGHAINMFTTAEWRRRILLLTTNNGSNSLTTLLETKPKRNRDQMRATEQSNAQRIAASFGVDDVVCRHAISWTHNRKSSRDWLRVSQASYVKVLCLIADGSTKNPRAAARSEHNLKLSGRVSARKWHLRCRGQASTKGRNSRAGKLRFPRASLSKDYSKFRHAPSKISPALS